MLNIKKPKTRYSTPVLFRSSDELISRVRTICDQQELTMSHFIRESVKRNIVTYEKAMK